MGIGANSHGIGGRISVADGLPDQLSTEGGKNVYTDQMDFILFREDAVYTQSPSLWKMKIFRRVHSGLMLTKPRQVLYVAGLPKLSLVSDQQGEGISRMVWSKQSRALSIPHTELSDVNRSTFQAKRLRELVSGLNAEPIRSL